MIVVRFADDIVLGFQYKSDAERFWEELAHVCASFDWSCIPTRPT
jgi:hypothetical protein